MVSIYGKLAIAATSTILAMTATPAQAFNFTNGLVGGTCQPLVTPGTTLSSCTTEDGFTITSDPRPLESKRVGGVIGVGVQGGFVGGEIDLAAEKVTLDLPGDQPAILKSLDLSFLYLPGEFRDTVFEKAQVKANTTGGFIDGYLTVGGENTVRWQVSDLGIDQELTALSASTDNPVGGGWYSILEPFGNTSITNLELTAVQQGTSPGAHNSDFSLVGAVKTPEPTTLVGLGLVASALLAVRRRQLNH